MWRTFNVLLFLAVHFNCLLNRLAPQLAFLWLIEIKHHRFIYVGGNTNKIGFLVKICKLEN